MRFTPTFTTLLVFVSPTLAAQANDPWAGVPPLPTSCYRQGDRFDEAAGAATEELNRRQSQQTEINQAIEQQYREVDPMDMQQRMMTFLMEHPDQAQKYMEALTQGGQQVAEQTPEMAERSGQFDTELKELTAAYQAELQQAMGPIEQRQQALGARLSNRCTTDLAAQAAALNGEKNRAYEGVCANWWQSGPFHDWFTRYRQFKIEEAAHWARYAEDQRRTFELGGVDADQYRATDEYKGPIEYLRRATDVFFRREWTPVSEEVGDCEIRHG